ncbi:hypothetical protein AALP_AA6G070300 [Arabis alpina]|uniref:Protein kinase domain-containing protein n=1 Tax=Arabis alpina TaxID=50452 RepID=A0A087GML6_ARAAL|nr:hypothetical protein AALP_AA6G070300 [Arabis alpina]
MEWTLGRILGRGSTATVCIATCHNSDELLAVKSVELHRSEFLQREAKILSSLNSPYVIGYRGAETKIESNGVVTYNLLMEYAPYGTLTDATAKNGGRFEEESMVVKYTREILLGLEYIHSMGIAHCDVKGSNVVVSEKGEAKIADFGCSRRVNTGFESTIMGTPAFMAPEVARGEKQGKESDIWAVGCTVIEMVTGSPPWKEEEPVSVLYRVGSPTSVTDQMYWRSVEEEEEAEELQGDSRDLDRLNLWSCHLERFQRLRFVDVLDGPKWDMEGGDWIMVR